MKTLLGYTQAFASGYRRFFSIEEIEQESIVQWYFGGSLFFFFVVFYRWISSDNLTIEQAQRGGAVCWEYFQNCTDYYFLHSPGNGYSQSLFYMGLYAIMLGIVYFMWKKNWVAAHLFLLILFVWEVIATLVLSFNNGAPYYYYHIILTSMLLFVPFKEYFLKLSFVWMYFMSVTTKLDSTWILGTYFTSLRDGLPLFPRELTPLFTNFVIFMQMIGCWYLMSRNKLYQRTALLFFLAFHLYSGVFVQYFYPSVSLPPLVILFGPLYRFTPTPFSKKIFPGVVILILVGIFQIPGFIASGDRRLTLEDNKFGMFMFEANHQCVVSVKTFSRIPLPSAPDRETRAGTPCPNFFCNVKTTNSTSSDMLYVRESRFESGTAWNRCYPYEWWSRYHTRCGKPDTQIERVAIQLDHSINGGPFYRTVDVPNICDETYHAFGGNSWIRMPPEAPLIGYPVMNTYN